MKQLSIYETELHETELYDDRALSSTPLTAKGQPNFAELASNSENKTIAQLPLKDKAASAKNKQLEQSCTANVTEIIIARNKADSIQMLLPMLNNLSQEKRWLAWIDPPIQLLKQWQESYSQLATEEIMILRSSDTMSAFELSKKALEAGTCHAVITWSNPLTNSEFEDLEQASAKGNSHGIILRKR